MGGGDGWGGEHGGMKMETTVLEQQLHKKNLKKKEKKERSLNIWYNHFLPFLQDQESSLVSWESLTNEYLELKELHMGSIPS